MMRFCTTLVILVALSGALLTCSQGAAVGGGRDKRTWFRTTLMRYWLSTSTVTETVPATCVHIEPNLEPCDPVSIEDSRNARRASPYIRASATLHTSTFESTKYDLPQGGQVVSSISSSLDTFIDELDDEIIVPEKGYRTGNMPYHKDPKLFMAAPIVSDQVMVLTETKRIIDPEHVVTLMVTKCRPSVLPFHVPLCEEAFLAPSVTTNNLRLTKTPEEISSTRVDGVKVKTPSSVSIATDPLLTVKEKVSVSPIQVDASKIMSDTTQVKLMTSSLTDLIRLPVETIKEELAEDFIISDKTKDFETEEGSGALEDMIETREAPEAPQEMMLIKINITSDMASLPEMISTLAAVKRVVLKKLDPKSPELVNNTEQVKELKAAEKALIAAEVAVEAAEIAAKAVTTVMRDIVGTLVHVLQPLQPVEGPAVNQKEEEEEEKVVAV